jgi:hypothetical protein
MDKWLAQIEGMLTSATADMTEEQLVWHPEGKWSTAEVLEHLARTYTGTALGYEKALASQRSLASPPKGLRQPLGRFVLLTLGYFPPGRRSPERVLPKAGWSGAEATRTIHEELAKLIESQHKVEAKFAGVCVADHPVLGPLTPAQWAKFHYIHARHHMKQIATLRRQMATAHAART